MCVEREVHVLVVNIESAWRLRAPLKGAERYMMKRILYFASIVFMPLAFARYFYYIHVCICGSLGENRNSAMDARGPRHSSYIYIYIYIDHLSVNAHFIDILPPVLLWDRSIAAGLFSWWGFARVLYVYVSSDGTTLLALEVSRPSRSPNEPPIDSRRALTSLQLLLSL